MNANWKPAAYYSRDKWSIDALVLIEICAFALLGLAFAWVEYLLT